jgi:hypothetical protein
MEITKNLSENLLRPGRDLNRLPPEYNSGAWLIRHSARFEQVHRQTEALVAVSALALIALKSLVPVQYNIHLSLSTSVFIRNTFL